MTMRFRLTTVLSVGALLLAMPLGAQTHRGVIRGLVEDASGARIAGADITAANEATNDTRRVVSSGDGSFAIVELAPGAWRLEVSAPGHKVLVQRFTL